MSETRWYVSVLPGGELAATLFENDVQYMLQLSVATEDPKVIEAVERAAERNGMILSPAETMEEADD